MLIPIRTDYRMRSTPWVNYALLVSNIVLFLAGLNSRTPEGYARVRHELHLLLDPEAPQLHQFFTYMFLHGDLWHLLGNMLFLWVFGPAINDRLGNWSYLMFYVGGGVMSGAGHVMFSSLPVLGASGAISAVTGAFLVLAPVTRVTTLVILFIYIVPLQFTSLVYILFQFLYNLWMAAGSHHVDRVAYGAHTSGYVYGIAVAAGLLLSRLLPRDEYDLLHMLKNYYRRARYRRLVGQGYDPFSAGRAGRAASPQRPPEVQAPRVGSAGPDAPPARELQLRGGIAEACSRHDLAEAGRLYLQLRQLDGEAVLSRQHQLDVANQFMASQQHAEAAEAYELFLKHYTTFEHAADVYLMLGVLYGRYLLDAGAAEERLRKALDLLHDDHKLALARAVLAEVGRAEPPGRGTA